MARILTVCSLKSSGASTLILGLAGALAEAGRSVRVVDMARNGDLSRWADKPGRPKGIRVVSSRRLDEVELQIVRGLREEDFILLDAGLKPERILAATAYADLTLIPVRFSPLSAYWATQTDTLVQTAPLIGKSRRHAFVATGITQIPSRVARQVEARLELSRTARLPAGLTLRAAHEAPFLHGGTIFTLSDDRVSGLDKARADVLDVAREIGIIDRLSRERTAANEAAKTREIADPATVAAPPRSRRLGIAALFELPLPGLPAAALDSLGPDLAHSAPVLGIPTFA